MSGLILLLSCLNVGQKPETLQVPQVSGARELLKEYPAALQMLEDYYRHTKGIVTEEEFRPYIDKPIPKGQVPTKNRKGVGGIPFPLALCRSSEVEFRLEGEWTRLESRRKFTARSETLPDGRTAYVEIKDAAEPLMRVFCVGESGSFQLHEDPSTGKFTVDSVSNVGFVNDFVDRSIRSTVFAPFLIERIRILDLLKDPTFKVLDVKQVKDGERSLLHIDFTVDHKNKKAMPFRTGWFEVSPSEHWVLVRYEMSSKLYERASVREVKYARPSDESGIPVLVSVKDSLPSTVVQASINHLVHESSSKQDFTLTAFGLPDITKPIAEHVPGRSAAWYFWAAGGAILVALGLRFAASRNARRSGQAA